MNIIFEQHDPPVLTTVMIVISTIMVMIMTVSVKSVDCYDCNINDRISDNDCMSDSNNDCEAEFFSSKIAQDPIYGRATQNSPRTSLDYLE